MRRAPNRLVVVVLALGLSTAGGAGATTALPIADTDLLAQAAAIAELSVLSVSPAPGSPIPSTDHIVLVGRLFKGRLPGTTIVVRLPGGLGGDGIGLEVDGLPRLAAGDRLVAFLEPRDDGTYGALHLALGLFLELPAGRDVWAVPLAAQADENRMRDLDRWTAWLAAPGERPWSATLRPVPAAVREKVSALREALAARDRGAAPDAMDAAAASWRIDPALPLTVAAAWETAVSGPGGPPASDAASPPASGLAAPDAGSWLAADGARAIPGRFDCAAGGLAVLSATRYRLRPASSPEPSAGAATEALGTTLLLNDGTECLTEGGPEALGRLLADEVGAGAPPAAGASPDVP